MQIKKQKVPEEIKSRHRSSYADVYARIEKELKDSEDAIRVTYKDDPVKASRCASSLRQTLQKKYGDAVFSIYRDGDTVWIEKR